MEIRSFVSNKIGMIKDVYMESCEDTEYIR